MRRYLLIAGGIDRKGIVFKLTSSFSEASAGVRPDFSR